MTPGRIFNLVTAACLAAAIAWWFWPSAAAPKKTPARSIHAPAAADAPAEASPQPEAAIPPPAASPPPAEPISTATGADPQAELNTAIPDMIRLIQSGDMLAVMQNYMPPDQFAQFTEEQKAAMAQQMQAMSQNPQMQQRMQTMVQALESIRGATPVLDATGEKATFTPMALPGTPSTMNFIKINGRWYIGN